MSRYDDDFEDELVPVSNGTAINSYSSEEDEDEDQSYLLKKLNAVSNLATKMRENNSKETLSNMRFAIDVIAHTFLEHRLKNGLKAEDMKKALIERFWEVLPSCTPQEMTDMFRAISDSGVADLDRLLGPRNGGININMQGPTTTNNVYDNRVENQINQTQQNVYANDKASKALSQEAITSIGKFTEAADLFKQIGIPRQNQVEYKPAEKLPDKQKEMAEAIDANFEEIKKDEKKYMNED